jgi:hypothetical protein
MTSIDPFSLTTVPVEQLANGTRMRSATAFVWKHGAQHYLITNWHVVTGKNAYTGEQETPAAPDTLRCLFNVQIGTFEKQPWDIPLRDNDRRPRWLIRPGLAPRVDVVAIPISLTGTGPVTEFFPINTLLSNPLNTRIGMDVFILGYPFGNAPPAFPVWKRGSIASEPELALITTGYYLVDTASRPGMSGAPVILRDWTNDYVDGAVRAFNSEPATNFLGVYSGRLQAATDEAQIGVVWHGTFIEDIIAGNLRDE